MCFREKTGTSTSGESLACVILGFLSLYLIWMIYLRRIISQNERALLRALITFWHFTSPLFTPEIIRFGVNTNWNFKPLNGIKWYSQFDAMSTILKIWQCTGHGSDDCDSQFAHRVRFNAEQWESRSKSMCFIILYQCFSTSEYLRNNFQSQFSRAAPHSIIFTEIGL